MRWIIIFRLSQTLSEALLHHCIVKDQSVIWRESDLTH